MTMSRAARAGYTLAAAVFLIDQLAKWLVAGPLDLTNRLVVSLMPSFDLRFVQNFGVSMGFLVAGSNTERWMLVAMTGIIAAGVAWWIRREATTADALALGAVLGGALGNILDRVRLGYVFDFLDLHFTLTPAMVAVLRVVPFFHGRAGEDWHPFLVFNVADAAISVGVAVLLLRAIFVRPAAPQTEKIDA